MLERLHRLFDRPVVFNTYQRLVDGGKGRRIRRFLSDVSYSSVLDVGCGTGNWADLSNGWYVGIDLAPDFISSARERFADDPRKAFRRMDARREDVPGRYDLLQLISVLHHLSDDDVRDLLTRLTPNVHYLFILDLYPIRWNPIARILYGADRGAYIRSPEKQKRLIESASELELVKEDDFFAPTGLYRHTMLLYR